MNGKLRMQRLYPEFSNHSERIYLKEYFENRLSSVTRKMSWAFKPPKMRNKNCLATILGRPISGDELKIQEEACSVSLLEVEGEPQPIRETFLNGTMHVDCSPCPSKVKLRTLATKNEESTEYRKYGNRIWKKVPDEVQDLKVNEDIIITLRVYEPIHSQMVPGLLKSSKEAAEMLVLGRQTLAEFRDAIICSTDFTVPGEMSNDPERAKGLQEQDLFKSGFIFIDDVFYNDFRHAASIDYSDPIIKWAEENNIGPFTKKDLDKVCFIDLTVRFGHPYVYVHQGNCEHLIVFSNARLLHTNDTLDRSKYPICLPVYGKQARYCMMCYQYLARWLVKENDRLPHDVFFFCKDCFFSFNYINGKKIGNFKAYMYQERLGIL